MRSAWARSRLRKRSHVERRPDALAADVGDDDADVPDGQAERVVEVAGHLQGGLEPDGDLPAGWAEHLGWEEAELDLPPDLEFLFEPLRVLALALVADAEGLLGVLPLGDVAEEPDPPVVVALLAADRCAVAVEDPAVAQEDLVAALLVGMLVQVGDAGEEGVGVVELGHHGPRARLVGV